MTTSALRNRPRAPPSVEPRVPCFSASFTSARAASQAGAMPKTRPVSNAERERENEHSGIEPNFR